MSHTVVGCVVFMKEPLESLNFFFFTFFFKAVIAGFAFFFFLFLGTCLILRAGSKCCNFLELHENDMWSVPGSFLAEQAVTEQSRGSGIRKSLPKSSKQ